MLIMENVPVTEIIPAEEIRTNMFLLLSHGETTSTNLGSLENQALKLNWRKALDATKLMVGRKLHAGMQVSSYPSSFILVLQVQQEQL